MNNQEPITNAAAGPIESWFNTPERISALMIEANSWRGTRFFANGNTKGMGVSCQKLVGAVYAAVGFCTADIPNVPMAFARFSRERSLVLEFMESRGEFSSIKVSTELMPGDLIGFRLGRIPHHLAIYLGANDGNCTGSFVHAIEGEGATISYLSDATWGSRFAAAWRPLGNHQHPSSNLQSA